jgi:hypothetical protein
MIDDVDSFVMATDSEEMARSGRTFFNQLVGPTSFDFDSYHETRLIYSQLEAWEGKYGAERAKVTSIGKTVNGNEIKAIRISAPAKRRDVARSQPLGIEGRKRLIVIEAGMSSDFRTKIKSLEKKNRSVLWDAESLEQIFKQQRFNKLPTISIMCMKVPVFVIILTVTGMHAREWISPATAMYIANDILSSFSQPTISGQKTAGISVTGNSNDASGTQSDLRSRYSALLEDFEFLIIPVVNPDGYDFSHSTELPSWLSVFSNVASPQRNRLWRKNRADHNKGKCYGVDLNRY